MDFDQTQPLPGRSQPTRNIYRCPCGNDIEIDPQEGGLCEKCQRSVPPSVTRLSMTMTITDLNKTGAAVSEGGIESGPDEFIGKRLGHFEIVESIGSGGMGQVYRALDTSLQRYVAVKVIKGSGDGTIDTMGQQRLLHEAVAQARVNHPNIVTIYFVGHEGEIPFLAMELVDGCDVSELIRQGEIPYESLCSIAIKITHALDTASALGIVHSDIKPQNLLVLNNGNIKLSDFGMARIGDDDPDKGVGGTPNYLAPELLIGGNASIQSDMYALGVTLFEMTFGRLPIELSGSTLAGWSEIHRSAKIRFPDPWPDHLPESWKSILQKLLQQVPQERYQGYEELGTSLRKILPVKRKRAKVVARSIAWFIDLVLVALFAIIAVIPVIAFAGLSSGTDDDWILVPALVVATLIEYWWRQSIGRELVHIRIVNQYGLVPARRTMFFRSMFRMQFLWFAMAGKLAGGFLPFVEIALTLTGVLLTAIDAIYAVTFGRGQCLHDRILKTEAIIQSDSN